MKWHEVGNAEASDEMKDWHLYGELEEGGLHLSTASDENAGHISDDPHDFHVLPTGRSNTTESTLRTNRVEELGTRIARYRVQVRSTD
jgi:hypothetical protein